MIDEFPIPNEASTLMNEGCEHPFALGSNVYVVEDGDEWQQALLHRLVDADALLDTDTFAMAYCLARELPDAKPRTRTHFITAMTNNLTSVLTTASSPPPDAGERCHVRTLLKAHLFVTSMLLGTCLSNTDQDSAAAPEIKRGTKKKNTSAPAWSWTDSAGRLVTAGARMATTNLQQLYSPADVGKDLINTWSQMALGAAQQPALARMDAVAHAVCSILCTCAVRLGRLDATAASLFDALKSGDHMPLLLKSLAEVELDTLHSHALTGALLQAVCTEDPAVYDTLAGLKGDQAGIRSVAAYVEAVAEAVPQVVLRHASGLRSLLGYRHYPLRSAAVTALGHLLDKGFEGREAEDTSSDQAVARLKSKQSLWDELLGRAMDESAFTRARVLQVLAQLAEQERLPLGMLSLVVDVAAARMRDKQASVRRAAMQLVGKLLQNNPFGADLSEAPLQATLDRYTGQLEALAAACGVLPNGQLEEDDGAQWGAGSLAVQAIGGNSDSTSTVVKEEAASCMDNDAGSASVDEGRAVTQGAMELSHSAPLDTRAPSAADENELQQLRTVVANLECALSFTRRVAVLQPLLRQLLASPTESDVKEGVRLLQLCACFCIQGAQEEVRHALPLVFKGEEGTRKAVLDMVFELHLNGPRGPAAADRLLALCEGLTMGQHGALEAVLGLMAAGGELHEDVVHAAAGRLQAEADVAHQRSCVSLLTALAPTMPAAVAAHLSLLLHVARQGDAAIQQMACVCVRHVATGVKRGDVDLSNAQSTRVHAGLMAMVMGTPSPAEGWHAVAKEAIGALYQLLPDPEAVGATVLDAAWRAVQTDAEAASAEGCVEEQVLARACTVLGEVALQQLVYIDAMVRQASKRPSKSQADSDQLGMGAGAADAAIEEARLAAETDIASAKGAVATYAPVLRDLCSSPQLLTCSPGLRAAALNALAKLMAVDQRWCAAHLQLLFTLLLDRNALEAPTRCTLVVAMGDLALRWPNLLNPWSRSVFAPLRDPDPSVRRTAMLVLTHLVLNDMFKVKGHMASMAVCLEDPDASVQRMASRFFAELTKRGVKGANPVYTHLPDVLSNLCGDAALPDAAFQRIMQRLLQHVSRDKHVDGLVEKLCLRFHGSSATALGGDSFAGDASLLQDCTVLQDSAVIQDCTAVQDSAVVATSMQIDGQQQDGVAVSSMVVDESDMRDARGEEEYCSPKDTAAQDNAPNTDTNALEESTLLWRRLAFCLSQLTPTDKGLRCLLDSRRLYQEALWDPVVAACFDDVVHKALAAARAKTRKGPQEGGALLGELAAELQAALRIEAGREGETLETSAVAALGASLQQVQLSASTPPAAHRLSDAEASEDEGPVPEGRRRRSVLAPEEETGKRAKRRLVQKERIKVEQPAGGESLRRRRSARTRKVAVGDSDDEAENQNANGGGFLVPAGRRSH